MTAQQTAPPRHAVSRAVAAITDVVAGLSDVSLWSMGPQEAAATLCAMTRLSARMSELELRVADHARTVGVGEASGATSTENWWAHTTAQTRVEAHRKMHLAAGLDRFALVPSSLAAGELLLDQADVIVRALEALPDEVSAETVTSAETELVDLATTHDARVLRILGRRILDVVDPAVGEAAEAEALAREERAAGASVRLTMSDDGQGRVHGRFTLPSAQGAMLRKALLALTWSPRTGVGNVDPQPARTCSAERLGGAFAEYVERYPTDRLPTAGGVAAAVVVTMSLDTLMGGLAAASLDTGERLSAGQARRLACEAGIVPAVLGGPSQVLDLGRRRRFHTEPQRIALALAQGGCRADGCDRPPAMCHAHHVVPWSRGGPTSVANGLLLCSRHHTRAHDPAYETRRLPGGKVAFHRRT